MSDRTFSVFAYNRADEDCTNDERRGGIPEWKLPYALGWALRRGSDSVHIEASSEPASSTRLVTNHVCRDPWCPGGCE